LELILGATRRTASLRGGQSGSGFELAEEGEGQVWLKGSLVDGVLQGTLDSDVAFTDALDLVAALRDSADVRRCLGHSYAMHVFGSARAFAESCVDPGIAALVRDDDSIVELAARLPATDAFVRRSTP
jgi:hypothetical protein